MIKSQCLLIAVLVLCAVALSQSAAAHRRMRPNRAGADEPRSAPSLSGSTPPPESEYQSVLCPTGRSSCSVVSGKNVPGSLAWGAFQDDVNSDGWGKLWVHTPGTGVDADEAFAAGFLEGSLTSVRIYQQYYNFMMYGCAGLVIPDPVRSFIEENDQWMNTMLATQLPESPYWHEASRWYAQVAGLFQGYSTTAKPGQELRPIDFLMLQLQGDISDVVSAVNRTARRDFARMTLEELQKYTEESTHCSAIVKVLPDLSEMYTAHTMWWKYYAMLRVYKYYDMPSSAYPEHTRQIAMSSYPGLLSSTDDFYQLSSGMTVFETTNAVYNNSLYDLIVPQTVFSWLRVMIAHRIARDGREWTNLFAQYNSGTYNNQWVVVNYNLFTPNQPLVNGTVWILEQLPGFVHSADVTSILQFGHWPSYNRAFFSDVAALSGIDQMAALHGPYFTYQLYNRAQIFRRDADTIKDIDSLQRFIRANNWLTDPLSEGSAANQIAARGDLIVKTIPYQSLRGAWGAIDAKVTSSAMQKNLNAIVQCGPTTYSQVPFTWTTEFDSMAHMGHPQTFNFDWVSMNPDQSQL